MLTMTATTMLEMPTTTATMIAVVSHLALALEFVSSLIGCPQTKDIPSATLRLGKEGYLRYMNSR